MDILRTHDQCICVSQPVLLVVLNESTKYKTWKAHLKFVLQCLLISRYSDQKQHHQVPTVILPYSEIFNVLRLGLTSHSVRTQTLHIIYHSLEPTFLSLMLNMSVSLLALLPFIMDIRRHSLVVLISFASCECKCSDE